MKITIPLEVTVHYKKYKSDRKTKKVPKEIKTYLVNYLKNLYIPILADTDMVIVKKIKTGKIK